MPKNLRYTLLSIRDIFASAGSFIMLTVLLLVLSYWWLDPNPPKQVRLATGPENSAYDAFGQQYAKILAQQGIQVSLLASNGAADNLALLESGQVDFAFVRGGSAASAQKKEAQIESLGSLFMEPIWLFYRIDSAKKINTHGQLHRLSDLKGLRLNIDTPGSGVPNLMRQLFKVNQITSTEIALSELAQTPATVAFLNADIDALVFASAPESLMVQMLLQTPGVALMDFAQSEAYSRRFQFLSPVILPRGVVDLAHDIPAQDVRLVASTTSLLTAQSTHPALQQLFAQAAQNIHGGAGWFNRALEFPNSHNNEFPLSAVGERTIKNPQPLLQRYMTFWLANLVERMWLALGIILALLLPLSRIVPPLYAFRVRSRVFRWYGKLRDLESQIDSGEKTHTALRQELAELESHVEKINLPLSYTDELYALRNHIHLVRKKLGRGNLQT